MTIQDVIIQHEDTQLQWKLDDDYLSYMHLCSALVDELMPLEVGTKNIKVSIAGILANTGAVCHRVNDDQSLYNLFVRNNPPNPITLVVNLEVVEEFDDSSDEVEVVDNRPKAKLVEIDEIEEEVHAGSGSIVPYVNRESNVHGRDEQPKLLDYMAGVEDPGVVGDFDGLEEQVEGCVDGQGVCDMGEEVTADFSVGSGNVVPYVNRECNVHGRDEQSKLLDSMAGVEDPGVVGDFDGLEEQVEGCVDGQGVCDMGEEVAADFSNTESDDDPLWATNEDTAESESFDESFIVQSDEDELLAENVEADFDGMKYRSDSSDTEAEVLPRKRRRKIVQPKSIPLYDAAGKVQLVVHQLFNDHHQFKQLLRTYVVEQSFEYKKIKCSRDRMTYACAAKGCIWRVHASKSPYGTQFMIKTYMEEHTFQSVRLNRCASSAWIARVLEADFQEDPNLSLSKIRAKLREKFGVSEIPKQKLFRARVMARGGLYQAHVEQFSMLRCYANMVLTTNPGSMAIIQSDATGQPPYFQRVFISLDACRRGFLEGCRPVIGIDGCHLKGPFGGILLSAISVEANMGWFPVAYAVVEQENSQTWEWFLTLLREAIGRDIDAKPWCIISDRQKGLVQAVHNVFPMCTHRNCCHHIWQNLQVRFKETGLKDLFCEAARAPNVHEFESTMYKIRNTHVQAHAYLQLLEPATWAFHAMDSRVKCDHITSNFVESFNAWISDERSKPPISMLELIRSRIMELIYTRGQIASRWTKTVTPDVLAKVKQLNRVARHARVLRSGAYEFEVELNTQRVGVRLDDLHCDCGEWELRGFPCAHGLACINTIRADISDYCSSYFSTERWRATFAAAVHPIRSRNYWPEFPPQDMLQPPLSCKRAGRPKKHRSRSQSEQRPVSTRNPTVSCKVCKGRGHNKRGCPQNQTKKTRSTDTPLTQELGSVGTQAEHCRPSNCTTQEELLQSQLSQL